MNLPQSIATVSLLASLTTSAWAVTELQLHYDMGEEREHFTTTVEMFKPDAYGNTFFFVDFNYDAGDVEGVSEAYWEVARAIKLTDKIPGALHIEYDGGLGQLASDDGNSAYTINDAWLVGPEFSWNADDFSKGAALQLLYKNIRDKHDDSYQVTLVWYWHMLNNKVTFRGFADYWKEDSDFNFDGTADDDVIFLTEPQLWYNINEQFSVGTEIEIGYNFALVEDWEVNPTIAAMAKF